MLRHSRRPSHDRTALALYEAAVAAARDPAFYERLGVPDTLDGRFDMVGLHTFLVIRRLTRDSGPGPALAQALFDTMFRDMDANLREIGVGDLSVKKKMKQMWEAFHGRAAAYEAALADADPAALPAALARNVWRGGPAPAAKSLARIVRTQAAALDAQEMAALTSGKVRFLPFAEAMR